MHLLCSTDVFILICYNIDSSKSKLTTKKEIIMRPLLATLCCLSTPVFADTAPKVVADTAPVRALVAQIMQGVGEPSQIIPNNASPHGYAMRPSEARALQSADLVVWVGPSLTNWLEEPLETLASDAVHLPLMTHPGTQTLPLRAPEAVGEHENHADEGHEDHDDHDDHGEEGHDGHDDHAKEGHDDHENHAKEDHEDHGHEDEDHAGAGHDGHDHSAGNPDGIDPHGWLSPANGVLWGGAIAQKLAELDPANASTYIKNWEGLEAEIDALVPQITATLAPYQDTSFVVLHDAFQYFEVAFGVEAEAFIIPGTGATPGPARMRELRDHLAEHAAVCAFSAPQENTSLLLTALDGQDTVIAELDPLGTGDQSYGALLQSFADGMAGCLGRR